MNNNYKIKWIKKNGINNSLDFIKNYNFLIKLSLKKQINHKSKKLSNSFKIKSNKLFFLWPVMLKIKNKELEKDYPSNVSLVIKNYKIQFNLLKEIYKSEDPHDAIHPI